MTKEGQVNDGSEAARYSSPNTHLILEPNRELRRLDLSGIQAAILDLDGTMADSLNQGHKPAWRVFAEKMGFDLTEQVQRLVDTGGRNDQIMPLLLRRTLTTSEITTLSLQKEEIYRQTYQPVEVGGLTEFLDKLQARGIRLAVATSAPIGGRRFLMEGLGVQDRFEVIVGQEDIERGKPAPDAYQNATERLGIPVDACIAFEDTPAGVTSARRAGIRDVVGISTSYNNLEGATFMVSNFGQIELVDSGTSTS